MYQKDAIILAIKCLAESIVRSGADVERVNDRTVFLNVLILFFLEGQSTTVVYSSIQRSFSIRTVYEDRPIFVIWSLYRLSII